MQEAVEMKKYMKVVRHGKRGTHLIAQNGENIIIQEKLDGANASFKLNSDDGEVDVFSRRYMLHPNNTLRGFYNYVQENVDKDKILPHFIYFGEWLVRHRIDYGEENMNQFYLFDIYSELDQEYLPFEEVQIEAEELGLNIVPVFYEGEYLDFQHIKSFVGKSKLGDVGEGVVVKNPTMVDKYGFQMYSKVVSKDFEEMKQKNNRGKEATDPTELPPETQFVRTYLTKARTEKMIHKLVDEGVIEDDFDITDMGTILKNAGGRIVDDLLEEEKDELPKGYEKSVLKKSVGKVLPIQVKEIIATRN